MDRSRVVCVCPEERETGESLIFKPEILVVLLPFYSGMFGEVVRKRLF